MGESNQYTTTKVQSKDFTSGWMVAFIIAGSAFTISFLYLGSEIALNLGFKKALLAFGISTTVLTILCLFTTIIGNRSRLSTYMILHFSFGRMGAKIINVIVGFSLIGWFAVNLELLALTVQDTAIEMLGIHLPIWIIVIVVSVLITVTTIYGVKSIEKLANIAVPFMLIFLIYVAYVAMKDLPSSNQIWNFEPANSQMSLFNAVAMLVGSSILFPVLMADFSRFVYNDKQSRIAVLGITIGFPIALILAAIPSIITGEVDIIKIMKSLNLILPAFILMIISTWVTNAVNLYSTTLTISTIKSSWKFKPLVIVMSVFGTTLALVQFTDYFFDFLNLLGVFSPSISVIYIIDFFWIRKQKYNLDEIPKWGTKALLSWATGSVISLFTYLEVFEITHAYFVDSFLIAGIIYIILNKRNIIKSQP